MFLFPSFTEAFWRSEEFRRFRDFPGFAKRKGHFEPDAHLASADRWAGELARDESAHEVRVIYETAVAVLGIRRSAMVRTETTLSCGMFSYDVTAAQDPAEPSRARLSRQLRITAPLNALPAGFDGVFPRRVDELVVPVSGALDRLAALRAFEDWEHQLRARLSESENQDTLTLRLPSGFTVRLDFPRHETVFSFDGVSGVTSLGPALERELRVFGIARLG